MEYFLKLLCSPWPARSVMVMTRAFRGALRLLRNCAHVKPGEEVLIVTDSATDAAIAKTIMAAATRLGIEACTITMKPRALPGEEPPEPVVAAMLSSDVIIAPISRSLYHTNARTKACRRGARLMSMPGATMSVLASDAMLVDFAKQERVLKKFVEMLTRAKHITLTNPSGTDLELSVSQRRGHGVSGMCRRPGEVTGVPDIEAYIAPVEGSTNGTIVVDGSTSITGVAKQPITIDIERGIATRISGGSQARTILRTLRKARTRAAFRVGEFAVGLNPLARIRGALIEDEGVLGTAHVALGDNTRLGGKNKAPVHIDFVLRRAHVEFDGKTVLDEKRLTL
jgi:leucyl aminopeptidase (aminopeptidase T)